MERPVALALCGVLVLAFLLRALAFPDVFPGGGEVFLRMADSAYHARRALWSFVNFPAVLHFDPYLAHPDGAPVPMPPLYDWTLAAVARLFGDEAALFERVAAWASPVLGALTAVPVYVIGRFVGGPWVGLGAALLYAMLPASTRRSSVGDLDHHAAVALLLSSYLALILCQTAASSARRGLVTCLALALVRAALVLSWSGSLLYLALGEATLLLMGLMAGRRDVLAWQGAGGLLASALVAPWVAAAPEPRAGWFATTTLSWAHVLALASVGALAGALGGLARHWSGEGPWLRIVAAFAIAAGIAGALLTALPHLAGSLDPALAFLSKADTWGARNAEQQPLFSGDRPLAWALRSCGGFAMVLPVALLAPLVRARERRVRAAALALAAWSTLLGGLAVAQARFGNEFAPFASVGFALALAGLAGLLAHLMPSRAALAATLAVAGVLVTPLFAMEHLPTTSRTLAHLSQRNDAFRWLASDRRIAMETARVAGDHSLTRFARMVRRYTPETSGYLDARGHPEYGVLCLPRYGHDVHYWARRATPANNFGPYLDTPKYLASLRFFRAQTESAAVAIAASLGVRYVLSSDRAGEEQGYVDRVHAVHAPGRPSPPSPERLRLVVEGPAGGRPLLVDYLAPYPSGRVPFRLFELVEGAVLETEAPPGTPVVAETTVRPNLGRRFAYRR